MSTTLVLVVSRVLLRVVARAVLVVDELEEEEMKDGDDDADARPEEHWKATEVVAVLVQHHDGMFMRRRYKHTGRATFLS